MMWSKFDAVYCLSLADYKRRRDDMRLELERVGLTDVHWKITVKNTFYKYIWDHPDFHTLPWLKGLDWALNCTMGHYEIMKEALAIGYKRVLVMEDDIRFLKDTKQIADILADLPEADIALLDKNMAGDKAPWFIAIGEDRVNDRYIDYSRVNFGSTGCVAYSEKAMRVITERQEGMFIPADFSTNRVDQSGNVINDDGLVRVASIKNLAVQDLRYKDEMTELDSYIYKDIANLNEYELWTREQGTWR